MAAAEVFAGVEQIDAVHIDIQEEEQRVVPALMPLLNERVRRVHIGTHSHQIHDELGALFAANGWTPRRILPFMGRAVPTEIGPVDVNDGIQSWRNPRLA